MAFSFNIVCKALPIFPMSIVRCLQEKMALTWFVCVERREERKSDHEKRYASLSLRAMCPRIYTCKLSTYNPIIPHARQ